MRLVCREKPQLRLKVSVLLHNTVFYYMKFFGPLVVTRGLPQESDLIVANAYDVFNMRHISLKQLN